MLNREPNLPKRSGQNHPDALNKRITVWRQANRQKADAPYYIHQEGGEQAWEANQRLQEARTARLERIAKAEARGEAPKLGFTQFKRRRQGNLQVGGTADREFLNVGVSDRQ